MTGERRFTLDDIGVVAAGLVVFALAWLPWYEVPFVTGRLAYRPWDLGLLGVVPVLLATYAAVRVVWLSFRPLGPDVPLTPGAEPFVVAMLALLLTAIRVLEVPLAGAERTEWLSAAALAVVLQAVFALRTVARTGFRASPP